MASRRRAAATRLSGCHHPSARNGGGDYQPGRVAADDVRRFMREERAELVVRQLAQRADRHADFTRERDRHAQRAAAR